MITPLDEFPFPVWRAGLDGKCDYCNRAWLNFTGRTLQQELGDGWAEGVHPDDLLACIGDYRAAFQMCLPFQLTYRLRRSDGEFRWIADYGSPFNDGEENFAGYVGVCYDITESRKSEETLKKSEQLFAAFMDNLPGFAWMKDLDGRHTYVNAMLTQMEPRPAGWLGKTDAEVWPAEIAAAHSANDKTVITTGKSLQTVEPYWRKNEVRQALVSKFPIFSPSGAVEMVAGAGIDITELLQAEREHAQLAAIVQSSDDAIISKTLDGLIVSWNAGAEKIYGYAASEVIGRSITILAPPEHHAEINEILERIKRDESIEHFQTRRLRKDGTEITVSLTISPIRNRKGEVTGASTIARDISAQKRAEQALRESEQRFRDLAENIHEVFWLSDSQNTRMIYISPAYEKIWGRSCESLYADPASWKKGIHPEDREAVFAHAAARTTQHAYGCVYRVLRPDGSTRWVRDRGFPVRDSSGEVVRFAGIAEDITQSKEAEEALSKANQQLRILSRRRVRVHEAERMHLARELHDQIGQALTAAKISVQSARRAKKRERAARHLDNIGAILDQILAQVRQLTLDLRPAVLDDLGLAPALRLVLHDYARRAGWRIEFAGDRDLKRPHPEVETACFRIALEALTNILRHANAKKVWLEFHTAADSLHLIVRDDGVGFDLVEAEKGLERDRLGLVGMRERATSVGGALECSSRVGHGTEVHAVLPFHPV